MGRDISRGGQTPQKGLHTKAQMLVEHRDDRARDDLKGAFAGRENENSSKHGHHGTPGDESALKSRKTKKSAERTPKI